jgi:dipeptidyl aminopeptidase/acylaminoacyl peptidase
VPDRYRLASPRERLPLGVPQLLVHGELDDRVPVSMSRDHAAAASAAGDRADLAVIPGAGHPETIDPESRAWRAAAEWLGVWGPGR